MQIECQNGGRFISRGRGIHPTRRLDSWELIVVVKGVLGIFEDDRAFELGPDHYLILHPGRRHGGVLPYGRDLSFFWLHFTVSEGKSELPPQSGLLARPERVADYFNLLLANQESPEPDRVEAELLLRLLLNECAKSVHADPDRHRLVARAQEEIKLHFAEPISRATLSRKLHCNADYLGRIFLISSGLTVTAAINRTRLEYAAKLLRGSTDSIKEIARFAGFNDLSNFRRRFYDRYAVTPHVYRASHRFGLHVNTE